MNNVSEELIEQAIEVTDKLVSRYIRIHKIPYFIQRDDLLQEARIRMLRIISRYNPAKGTLKTFLFLCVNGAVCDHLRKTEGYTRSKGLRKFVSIEQSPKEVEDRLSRLNPDVHIGGNPESQYMRNVEIHDMVESAKKCLTPKEKKVIDLCFSEKEDPFYRVAEEMGMSPSWVSLMKDRSIKKMKEEMKEAA